MIVTLRSRSLIVVGCVVVAQDMVLQALLELNLHTFVAEVEEITDKAVKEEKMEISLVKLEEVWSNVNFVSSPYKEGSDVLLLAIAEEDFEM